MKNKLQIMVAIIGLGFAYGIYSFYDFWATEFPIYEAEEQQMVQKIATLEAESQKLQNFAKNIQSIKQEFRELNLQLEAVLEHMPRTFNLASLLRKLTMLAQNSGIEILVFKPRRDVQVTKPQDPNNPAPPTFYETISVEFALKGPFTQTLVFFDQLARLKRIVNVDSLKMITQRDSGTTPLRGAPILASTDVVIRTYRFTE